MGGLIKVPIKITDKCFIQDNMNGWDYGFEQDGQTDQQLSKGRERI